MEYYDEEDKVVLKGFSQVDMDDLNDGVGKLNNSISRLTIIIALIIIVTVLVGGYVFYWLSKHHYATRLLEALLG